ncbi:hypothetical protein PIB30_084713 [Stylosanthes scabra]|uniref:Uncharacterized protein n=1 Tax=Stylosanthes scabra TaxID=79078 RepID=A0ABU6XRP1_9FABA|nr:hypothetical protein [Stylosanthes scabra]
MQILQNVSQPLALACCQGKYSILSLEAEDLAIVCYLRLFQDTIEEPKKKQNHETDLLVSRKNKIVNIHENHSEGNRITLGESEKGMMSLGWEYPEALRIEHNFVHKEPALAGAEGHGDAANASQCSKEEGDLLHRSKKKAVKGGPSGKGLENDQEMGENTEEKAEMKKKKLNQTLMSMLMKMTTKSELRRWKMDFTT